MASYQAVNTSGILEIRNMYNSSLVNLKLSIEALKQGQVELGNKIHENLANFGALAENQEKFSSLIAHLIKSPESIQSVETPAPSTAIMAPAQDEIHRMRTVIGLAQPIVSQLNPTRFYSPSQTDKMELASSY